MDPTKNFDHLDPKLKDTYARVMGTAPAGTGDPTQTPAGQPTVAPTTPAINPPTTDPEQSMTAQPQTQFNPSPWDTSLSSPQDPNMGPNPGTGPTVSSIPTDTTTMVASPLQASSADPAPVVSAPATSSFFSNPSPTTTDPTQNPVQADADNNLSAPITQISEPAQAPITPYSPDNSSQYVPPADATQPLPSPSSVAQKAPRETSALLRVLYIIAAVIFFAIYTVFWIKVFNLPFLF